MANYPGRRKGTRRIVLWAKFPGDAKSRPREWIIEGSKKDGDIYEAQKKLELRQGKPDLRRSPTFLDFCTGEYEPWIKKRIAARTWNLARKYECAALCRVLGGYKLIELRTEAIEQYKDSRKIGARTLNHELLILGAILRYAKKQGYLVGEAEISNLPERGRGRPVAWTREQVLKLYDALPPWLVPLVVFLLNTGCRKGEAVAAEWNWIDLDARMLRIPVNEFWQPKSGEPREVPIADVLLPQLSGSRKHDRWVFVSRYGTRFGRFPDEVFREAVRKIGLRGSPHCLRHTFASHFLKKTKDLFLLAKILGHSHTYVTEMYSHLLPDHLEEARGAVNIGPETVA